MKNTFRKSKVTGLISELMKSGVVEEMMKELHEALSNEGGNRRAKFFESMSPMGREAFKLAYQLIENDLNSLEKHEDKEIRDKWFTHFVEYHNQTIGILKEGGEKIFTFAIAEHGSDYVNNVLRQDMRSIDEIMSKISNKYFEAIKLKDKYESELKDKLQTQLKDVVATLNNLTVEEDEGGIKHFEITLESALFEVTIGNMENGCMCGKCDHSLRS